MADHTNIEWCDATVNWWVGCTQISPGCDHCYAKRIAAPFWGQKWGPGVPLQRFGGALETLKALDRKAQRLGRPLVVFHNSVSDMGDKDARDEWRAAAFQGMAATPNLIHLVLTKRIGNLRQYLQRDKLAAELILDGRVWLGITVCNQEEANRDIPKLLHVPAGKRFLSCEPLLGPIQLSQLTTLDFEESPEGAEVYPLIGLYAVPDCDWDGPKLDWVIVGGESGPGARPMHPDWVRSVRDQCQRHDVPFMFKQWGEWASADQPECPTGPPFGRWMWADGKVFESGDDRGMPLFCRAGKKAAGRLLDGVEHNERPA